MRMMEKKLNVGAGLPRSYNRIGLIRDIDDTFKFKLSDSEGDCDNIVVKSDNEDHCHDHHSFTCKHEKTHELKALNEYGVRDYMKI